MSSSIGAFTFIQMTGPQLPSLAIAIDNINRKGLDGETFRDDGRKAQGIIKQTIEGMGALVNANTAVDDYGLLKGSLVTVVDDIGRTVLNVLVVDVKVTKIQYVINSAPTGTSYLVYAEWLLKPTG